jgi:hypothetical protein
MENNKLENIKMYNIMGRSIKILLTIVLSLLFFTNCEDQLDKSPLGELTSETFYNNEADFEAASLAPYSTILNLYYEQFGRGWFAGIWMPDDDSRNERGNDNVEEFIWLPDNGDFRWVWETSYRGIMRSNVILDRLPVAEGFADEDNKPRYEAEAKFIRAYFYFILVRNFGNVPLIPELIKTLDDSRVGNSQPGEVWDLIESDLEFAVSNLPDEWDPDNVGRATSWAARALLGKALLFRAQWEGNDAKYGEALAQLNPIIGRFSLIPDYADNFREESENNTESIWEIQMTRGDFNPWLTTDFGMEQNQNVGAAGTGRKIYSGAACDNNICAPGANGQGYGQIVPTQSLIDEFEPNDARLRHTAYTDTTDVYVEGTNYNPQWSVTGFNVSKYIRPMIITGFPNNWSGNNERVIRYADVLLMAAECELLGNSDVSAAAGYINQVRERARNYYEIFYGTPAPAGTLPDRPTNVSVEEMMDYLMHERRVELAFEVHRYDDLVRWHRAGLINIATDIDFGNTLANQNWDTKHLLKPIPQIEIDNNENLSQNPGY